MQKTKRQTAGFLAEKKREQRKGMPSQKRRRITKHLRKYVQKNNSKKTLKNLATVKDTPKKL